MLQRAFELPADREARRPPELRGLTRDGVSLLVSSNRAGSHTLAHFTDLPKYLRAGDLLVVNDSATIAAAVDARRKNGEAIRVHFSTRISAEIWIVEPRRTPLLVVGERLALPAGGTIELVAPLYREHRRLWYARLDLPQPVEEFLDMYARPIAYEYVDGAYPLEMYQTIFAREPGSVEMPSAGRPFTLRVVDALYRVNVNIASITLHCGVASPEAHEPPLDERFSVPRQTVREIESARRAGGRIVAVGTTVVRALESAAQGGATVSAVTGWTSHVVDREHPPRVVDGLLTGFHEPRASHLLMLEAFASEAIIADAYETALRNGLLWHEFGDVHLLLP